ncbi:MAG: hypothetical protein ACJAZO_002463 [Myxococcota bacterium]|jgi:hypothetical protein
MSIWAQSPEIELPTDDAMDDAVELDEAGTWGGIGLPYASANSTDGLGLGLGGELFHRPAGEEDGYDFKLTLSTYFAVNGRYQNHFVQVERFGERNNIFFQAGYSQWSSMLYVGAGGADVLVLRPPGAESGNRQSAPFAMALVSVPVDEFNVYVQGFTRFATVTPNPGGILDTNRPFGADGGGYGQLAIGVTKTTWDRFPLPREGSYLEIAVLGNIAGDRNGQIEPSGGIFVEAIRWHSFGRHLTIGARGNLTNMVGTQPFFIQDLLPGRLKDEFGFEQPLTGYGRTRTRGDGLWAAAVEVRPYVGRIQRGFFDMALYGSVYAEEAFLFTGTDPGPHMPTVGAGFDLVWQGATVLRPFAAWGWRAEPGQKRRGVPQFGLALKSPL